jgi:hypothetical protein
MVVFQKSGDSKQNMVLQGGLPSKHLVISWDFCPSWWTKLGDAGEEWNDWHSYGIFAP